MGQKILNIFMIVTALLAASEPALACNSGIVDSSIYNNASSTNFKRGCPTAVGHRGKCLIPYISVAADRDAYAFGDIIPMPGLKGKVINLGNGKTMKHPGYLLVEDTGGAINGSNRFDFFTGKHGLHDRTNSFGLKAPIEMRMAADTCLPEKAFKSALREGTTENAKALQEMYAFIKAAAPYRQKDIAEDISDGLGSSPSSQRSSTASTR